MLLQSFRPRSPAEAQTSHSLNLNLTRSALPKEFPPPLPRGTPATQLPSPVQPSECSRCCCSEPRLESYGRIAIGALGVQPERVSRHPSSRARRPSSRSWETRSYFRAAGGPFPEHRPPRRRPAAAACKLRSPAPRRLLRPPPGPAPPLVDVSLCFNSRVARWRRRWDGAGGGCCCCYCR